MGPDNEKIAVRMTTTDGTPIGTFHATSITPIATGDSKPTRELKIIDEWDQTLSFTMSIKTHYSRRRFIKLVMVLGFPRNFANFVARMVATHRGRLSYGQVYFHLLLGDPFFFGLLRSGPYG